MARAEEAAENSADRISSGGVACDPGRPSRSQLAILNVQGDSGTHRSGRSQPDANCDRFRPRQSLAEMSNGIDAKAVARFEVAICDLKFSMTVPAATRRGAAALGLWRTF